MAEAAPGAVAPVETPPGGQPVIAPDLPTGQENATPPGDESVKPPKTYSEEEHRKGISERLSKERRRLERTLRAELRAEAAERELQTLKNPQQRDQPKGEPQQKDFQDYEEYLLAKAEHRLEQRLAQQNEATRRETAQQQEARITRERSEAVQANFAEARDRYEDFDEVVRAEHVPFTEPMAAFFAESEKGGDMAYHLAQNLTEAKRISALSPAGVFRELVKLEATLSAPPQQTKTPPPIVPNGGAAAVKKDWGDMTTAEHVSAYHKRKRR